MFTKLLSQFKHPNAIDINTRTVKAQLKEQNLLVASK